MSSPVTGLYLHIPFCHARCGYCDFVTFTGKEERIAGYVQALIREIALYEPCAIETVFFGGGTPSLLKPAQVSAIVTALRGHFRLDPNAEITLESNPESFTSEYATGWREAGINRVSMGLQTSNNTLLKAIDRLHTFEDFQRAYALARAAGFQSLSIDLIYGLPGQTSEDWTKTLADVLTLKPDHLSLYALAVEANTPFAAQKITTNTDLQAEMYAIARDVLPREELRQYEISNFSKPGHACRHNLIYWRQQDYLGLGVGAVGCVGKERWTNHKTLQGYESALSHGQFPRQSVETLTESESQFERLMLGLRLREGMEWETESNPRWIAERERLVNEGLLETLPFGRWRIPDAYVAMTNQVLLPFLSE